MCMCMLPVLLELSTCGKQQVELLHADTDDLCVVSLCAFCIAAFLLFGGKNEYISVISLSVDIFAAVLLLPPALGSMRVLVRSAAGGGREQLQDVGGARGRYAFWQLHH